MTARKAPKELMDLLNQAVAREIQVSVQYMWQHVLWKGVKGFAVKDALKKIAIEEMKHAEAIAERLNYLGGTPSTRPTPVSSADTPKAKLKHAKTVAEGAIVLY